VIADAPPVPVADGAYAARTTERRTITLVVRDGRVVRAAATIARYPCRGFGDLGPVRVVVTVDAPIARTGRVAFAAGPAAERLAVRARWRAGGAVTGALRLRGTIGTGEPCASRRIRFSRAAARG